MIVLLRKFVTSGIKHSSCQTTRGRRKWLQYREISTYNGFSGLSRGRFAQRKAPAGEIPQGGKQGFIMRLALKLVLVFMLANIALAGIYGYLAVRREVMLFQRRAAAEAEELAPVIKNVLADVWSSKGDRGMRESLHRIFAEQQSAAHIRWVWFDPQAEPEFCPAASTELLTAFVIEEHLPVETDEPNGISYLRVYWPVALAAAQQGRAGVHASHGRV